MNDTESDAAWLAARHARAERDQALEEVARLKAQAASHERLLAQAAGERDRLQKEIEDLKEASAIAQDRWTKAWDDRHKGEYEL